MVDRRSFLRGVGLLALTLAAAGCETLDKLDWFDEKKTPLSGERKPMFPEGVPGVNYGEPPPQPANAPAAAETPAEPAPEPAQAKTKPQQKPPKPAG